MIPLLEKLRRAIHEQRRVLMVHRKSTEQQAQSQVEPYALVHHNGWWYVVGHCRLRNAMGSFRLDRIVELTLLHQTFQIPADFNVREHLAVTFESELTVQMRLRFAPQGAHVARDLGPTWETIEEQADGGLIVSLKKPDLMWATAMTLGFGPIVTVLEPAELGQAVREWAQAT